MSARVANRDNTVIEIKILKAEGGVEKSTGIPGFKRRKPAKDKQSMATLVLPTEFYGGELMLYVFHSAVMFYLNGLVTHW